MLSLMAATLGSAILNVLAIIAIVVVGAFIIVFLADLVISIIDGNNGIFFKRGKRKEQEKEAENTYVTRKEPILLEDVKEEKEELSLEESDDDLKIDFEKELNDGKVDLQEAEKEQALVEKKLQEEQELDELRAEKLEELEELEEDEEVNEEEDDFIDIINRINALASEEEDEEVDNTEAEDAEVEETNEEELEETTTEEVEEPIEQEDDKIKSLEEELEKLKEQIRLQQEENEKLNEALSQKPETVFVEEFDSLENYEARFELLQDRLKASEKELKANKKEYMPLYRIKKSMENDEIKLRRKEAIVAKQKIMLFGVNNYVVDPEKEQKLAEEIDVLDGLRLSVQHCKDVMESNKDRYPILEKTNKILTEQVAHIKADIAEVESKIKALKDKQGNGEGTEE